MQKVIPWNLKIKAGRHRSVWRIALLGFWRHFFTRRKVGEFIDEYRNFYKRDCIEIDADISFSGNCAKYNIGERQDQINKLFGRTFGLWPHKNSIRIGWRRASMVLFNATPALGSQIEILAYCYHNGTRITKTMGFVDSGKTNHYSISVYKNTVAFKLNDTTETLTLDYSRCPAWGYALFPYFGGKVKAPIDMEFEGNIRFEY